MIVWGGRNSSGPRNDGARYDPRTDSWTQPASGLAKELNGHAIVWTGAQMITVGGVDSNGAYYNDNYAYTPPRTVYLYMKP
jgi:N-acetylneuraminic acid mutarotase